MKVALIVIYKWNKLIIKKSNSIEKQKEESEKKHLKYHYREIIIGQNIERIYIKKGLVNDINNILPDTSQCIDIHKLLCMCIENENMVFTQ